MTLDFHIDSPYEKCKRQKTSLRSQRIMSMKRLAKSNAKNNLIPKWKKKKNYTWECKVTYLQSILLLSSLTWHRLVNMVCFPWSVVACSVWKKSSMRLHSYLVVVEYRTEVHNDDQTKSNCEKLEGTPYKVKCLLLLTWDTKGSLFDQTVTTHSIWINFH